MDDLDWGPTAKCSSCNHVFIDRTYISFKLSIDKLLDGPYPNLSMFDNFVPCPKCGGVSQAYNYTPEVLKSEFLLIRDKLVGVNQAELKLALEIITTLNPRSFDELYSAVKDQCPAVAEELLGFEGILNWLSSLGGSCFIFKEIEKLLK